MAVVLLAAGAEIELPSVDDLDLLLGMTQEVDDMDPETRELRSALGL